MYKRQVCVCVCVCVSGERPVCFVYLVARADWPSVVAQPVEASANVRCIPNCLFIRPADGNECSATWALALRNRTRPTVMALSRQNVPHLVPAAAAAAVGCSR